MFIKRFSEWIGLKEKLHNKQHKTPLVSERDIWWASMGENVGSEINGKGRQFVRPVIIYKKLSNYLYLVIPISLQTKTGSWFVNFMRQGKSTTAYLHQSRTIDYRRLYCKIGELENNDFKKIKFGFYKLYI